MEAEQPCVPLGRERCERLQSCIGLLGNMGGDTQQNHPALFAPVENSVFQIFGEDSRELCHGQKRQARIRKGSRLCLQKVSLDPQHVLK